MYYESKGEGFALVYVHGGFGGLGTDPQAETPTWQDHFARHFKVITYDRRASGRLSYTENGFTVQNFPGTFENCYVTLDVTVPISGVP